MFNTLRHVGSGGEAYVIETTGAPFDKDRPSKLARLACVRCRSKKVKCSGEKEGCRRCLDKSLTCCYNDTNSSRCNSKKAHARAKSSETEMVRSRATTASPPATMIEEGRQQEMTKAVSKPSDETSMLDFIDAGTDIFHGEPFDMDATADPLFSFSSYPTSQNPFGDYSLDFSMANTPELLSETSFTDGTFTSSPGTPRNCSSCSDILRTYEMVEVCLTWAPRDPSGPISLGPDETIRCQKEMMENCESRLACNTCPLNSEHALLLISICNKLFGSIVDMTKALNGVMESVTPVHSQGHNTPLLSPSSSRQNLFNKRDWAAVQTMLETRSKQDQAPSIDSTLGAWKIDDEDKLHVLKSLLGARTARLRDLVDRIAIVATANRWLAHSNMIRDLLQRMDNERGW